MTTKDITAQNLRDQLKEIISDIVNNGTQYSLSYLGIKGKVKMVLETQEEDACDLYTFLKQKEEEGVLKKRDKNSKRPLTNKEIREIAYERKSIVGR